MKISSSHGYNTSTQQRVGKNPLVQGFKKFLDAPQRSQRMNHLRSDGVFCRLPSSDEFSPLPGNIKDIIESYENPNFAHAYLEEADLTEANLAGANLTSAELTGAKLLGAKLTKAYLTWAKLTRANLTRANLTGANLPNVDN